MQAGRLKRTWTVIVADAEREVTEAVATELWRIGCTVAQASDGAALRALLRTLNRVDLLLADQHLPGLGPSARIIRQARVRHPAIKILFVGDLASLTREHAHLGLRELGRVVKALLEKP